MALRNVMSNPLPYIIVFFALTLVFLGVLTWSISVYYKANRCEFEPSIWCSDAWTCQKACTGSEPELNNACFNKTTNILSCLYADVTARLVDPCTNPSGLNDLNALSCPCSVPLDSAPSCLASCAVGLSGVTNIGACCCSDKSRGCATSNLCPTPT